MKNKWRSFQSILLSHIDQKSLVYSIKTPLINQIFSEFQILNTLYTMNIR